MRRFPRACRQRYKDGRRDTLYVRLPNEEGTMKRINLGPYDDPVSWQKYHQLKADWERGRGIDLTKPLPPAPADELLVVELFDLYLTAHRDTYARNANNIATTLLKYRTALRALGTLANLPAATLTAKQIRQWIYGLAEERRLARTSINTYLYCLQNVYSWGELQDHVPETTNAVVQSVRGLKRAEGGAKETAPRQPVDFALVEATLPYMHHDTPQTIIRLLMMTGARPTEICSLTIADIHKDEANGVWIYQPARHKNSHKGLPRTIVFGREAIDLLTVYITKHRIKSGRVFRPIYPGNRRALYYSHLSLRQAIVRATREGGLTYWTPYQIRHAVATRLEAEIGIDAARAVLGHSSALTTSGYIHRDLNTVIALAKKGGIGD